MKKKTAPESKIFTQGRNTDQKKNTPGVSTVQPGGSLLKKNEFTMILIAALAATVLVFFFFFRGSDTPHKKKASESASGIEQALSGLENRISALEVSFAKLASSPDLKGNQTQSASKLEDRISRIETAVNLKLDTLIERVNKLKRERQKQTVVSSPSSSKPVIKTKPLAPEKKVQVIKKKPAKTKTPKKTKIPKKTNQFHTIQKGETLWSISQKYKTTVAAIRKLNNLAPEDKIYPGSNLLVK